MKKINLILILSIVLLFFVFFGYQRNTYAFPNPLMDDGGSSGTYYTTSQTTYKDFSADDKSCSSHFYSKVQVMYNRSAIYLLAARVDNGLVGTSGYNLDAPHFKVHFECTGLDPSGLFHWYQTDHFY